MSLQALRAYAFLGIFTSHTKLTELGSWGVSIFFILSGFVMFYSYREKRIDNSIISNLKFSFKKIKKLYPLHILMTILAMVFMIRGLLIGSGHTIIGECEKIVLNLLLIQTWIPREAFYFSLNGVSWYLSVCLFIYFVFPLLLSRMNCYKSCFNAVRKIVVILIIQILTAVALFFLHVPDAISDNFSKWVTYILPLYRLGDFYIGCNLGYLYVNGADRLRMNRNKASVLEIVTIVLIMGAQFIFREQMGILGSEPFRYNLLFIPTSIAMVYLFAMNKGIVTKISTNKLLIFLGDISPFAFLIHQIVIRYFDSFVSHAITGWIFNVWAKTILCLIITIIVALIWQQIYKKVVQKVFHK